MQIPRWVLWAHSPRSEAVLAAQPDKKALGVATHLQGLHAHLASRKVWPQGWVKGPDATTRAGGAALQTL